MILVNAMKKQTFLLMELTRMKQIKTISSWREIKHKAIDQPLLLLKISLTCASSVTALKEMKALESDLPIYLVIVQTSREVSNAIEEDIGIQHHSPQLLILKKGKAVWQATHYKIKKAAVTEAIQLYV